MFEMRGPAAATPTTRPSACHWWSPSVPSASKSCSAAVGRWTSTFGRRAGQGAGDEHHPGAAGQARNGNSATTPRQRVGPQVPTDWRCFMSAISSPSTEALLRGCAGRGRRYADGRSLRQHDPHALHGRGPV